MYKFAIAEESILRENYRRLYIVDVDFQVLGGDRFVAGRHGQGKGELLLTDKTGQIEIRGGELATIPPPGIKPIKKKELYKKIRPIAPPEHQSFYDQFKPTAEEDAINKKRDADKAQLQKDKKKAKKAKIEQVSNEASILRATRTCLTQVQVMVTVPM